MCLAVLYIWILGALTSGLPYENHNGPSYGDEWLMFLNEKSQSQVMNFSKLPEDINTMLMGDAYYYLYTRCNTNPEKLEVPTGDNPVRSRYFNPSNDIKVITHGWLSSEQSPWLQNMKDTFLSKEDYNVITVDWSELAENPIYPWSACSTKYVGKKTAHLLNALAKTYQIDGKNIHLIGHSLGSHVMGYTGNFSNHRIYRITGLDPARPLFELPLMPAQYRLEKSDAEYVDIIHTCGGVLGYKRSHGHADFYPNDGQPRQPGCEGVQEMIETCSHSRAYQFFEESITTRIGFIAYPCDSWKKFDDGECRDNPVHMGYQSTPTARGNYYLHTNVAPDYAKGYE